MLRTSCVTGSALFKPLALKEGSADTECNNEKSKHNPKSLLKIVRSGWPFKSPVFVKYHRYLIPVPKVLKPSLYILLSFPYDRSAMLEYYNWCNKFMDLIFFILPPQCYHMSLMDFVVSTPGCGRHVTNFWGREAHEVQLCCPDEVDGDIWIWSTRSSLKPNKQSGSVKHKGMFILLTQGYGTPYLCS
jgi:hypothetical protein